MSPKSTHSRDKITHHEPKEREVILTSTQDQESMAKNVKEESMMRIPENEPKENTEQRQEGVVSTSLVPTMGETMGDI